MNEDGFCAFACEENLALRARLRPSSVRKALATLCDPDPRSSDLEYEGRRIERVPGGWMVLNSAKYRRLAIRSDILQSGRERIRKFREKEKKSQQISKNLNDSREISPISLVESAPCNKHVTLSEAYAYAEAESQNLSLAPLTEKHGHIPLAGPVYDNYPRHEGRAAAIKTITKKIKSLAQQGWVEFVDRHGQLTRVPIENEVAAAAFLQESALEFGRSPAGMKGEFVPHPATWFNQERFTDDRQQWYRENSNGNGSKASREARTRAIAEQVAFESDDSPEDAVQKHH